MIWLNIGLSWKWTIKYVLPRFSFAPKIGIELCKTGVLFLPCAITILNINANLTRLHTFKKYSEKGPYDRVTRENMNASKISPLYLINLEHWSVIKSAIGLITIINKYFRPVKSLFFFLIFDTYINIKKAFRFEIWICVPKVRFRAM